MFLMPSAACCSDTSLSLGTTGILGECGRDWPLQGLRRLSCFAYRGRPVEGGGGRFTADQKRASQNGQIGGGVQSAAGVEVTDLLCGFGRWRQIWMKQRRYQGPRQTHRHYGSFFGGGPAAPRRQTLLT
jgi:hypothetical protein